MHQKTENMTTDAEFLRVLLNTTAHGAKNALLPS
jgi:hypothetical protein